ncbi:MAG TPA: hypothetical protein VEH07_01835 [Alphaproteobacteria bacterium]|nr:hypothetical protein [Alphaproteobacteria bacterium]
MGNVVRAVAPRRRVVGIVSAAGVLASLAGSAFLVSPAHAINVAKKAKDTCSIARIGDVSQVIGRVLSDPTQDGPAPDEDNAAVTKTRCQFDAESGHVTVISSLFPTADGAKEAFTQSIDNLKATTDSAGRAPNMSQEAGIGDDAYWVTSTVETDTTPTQQGTIVRKGTYFVLSGTRFVSVGTDWSDADPDTLKPALLKLTQSVIERTQTASR